MFCYQCEQTSKGEGCTKIGVCGKTAEVAALQDLLIYGLKGLSLVAVEARKQKLDLTDVNRFTLQATFSTLTNVDFDPARLVELIGRCAALGAVQKRHTSTKVYVPECKPCAGGRHLPGLFV
mgnify:CR=1 FL=1